MDWYLQNGPHCSYYIRVAAGGKRGLNESRNESHSWHSSHSTRTWRQCCIHRSSTHTSREATMILCFHSAVFKEGNLLILVYSNGSLAYIRASCCLEEYNRVVLAREAILFGDALAVSATHNRYTSIPESVAGRPHQVQRRDARLVNSSSDTSTSPPMRDTARTRNSLIVTSRKVKTTS